ncbi:ABC transporter ATP-binding protein [Haliovirga abyssi]|uniref:ABC transporter ATP-binding protein n=1 Tax=Haliovirga abyssi TaxID=2996794 RepID=A0AAU9DFN1_9FUSO|nr:ABC transporter ATP-binding protein [Haliovirga abyssi]BDU49454.1 ABC transporter ATP-binding protein [Haliovirga abyssi]
MNYITTVKEIFKFMRYLKPFYKFQFSIMFVLLISTILGLINPLVYKMVVDDFFIGKNIEILYFAIAIQIIVFIFTKILSISKEYLSAYMGNFISMTMRKNAFDKIMKAEASEMNKINIGEIFVTFDNDILAIENAITGTIINLILTLFNFITNTLVMFLLSWKYGIVVFLVIPFQLINNNIWIKHVMEKNKAIRKSVSEMFEFVNEAFSNMKYLKLLTKENFARRVFFKRNSNMVIKIFDSLKISWITGTISEVIGLGDSIFLLIVGGGLIYKGEITLGTYMALMSYSGTAKGSFMSLLNFNINMAPVMISIERLEKLLQLSQDNLKGEKPKEFSGDIELKNLDFYYEENNYILKEFELKIKRGEKLALIGESGSGKSTIINLIMGLYNPINGEIRVNGYELRELDKRYFRKKIGIVSQDSFFFSDNIRNNLLLGDKAKDEEIMRVCKICQIDKFINDSPNGLETLLEFGGTNLSGGQRQRLSIARMLLRQPEIIILDEATSALDNITEACILKSLEEELKTKTVITIAHRLSTIESSDRIIVLKDGVIVEEGTHEILLEKRGDYYNLQKLRSEDKANDENSA